MERRAYDYYGSRVFTQYRRIKMLLIVCYGLCLYYMFYIRARDFPLREVLYSGVYSSGEHYS